jgi:hypothetical protein
MPATFLDLEDEDEDEKIRSRWSCSTLATLAPPPTNSSPNSPTFAAASARLRLHLASVARRVRIRRAGWSNNNNGSGERTASIHSAEETLHVRSSSEPVKLWFELWEGILLGFSARAYFPRAFLALTTDKRSQHFLQTWREGQFGFGPLLFLFSSNEQWRQ